MKTKTLLLLFFLFATVTLQAQVSKTVNCTAGALATLLTSNEKATVTNLTLTGTIDKRDFTFMNSMPLLEVIDMSTVAVAAYSIYLVYPASQIPSRAFGYNKNLKSINISSLVTTIGSTAFISCSGLTSVTIPSSVTSISSDAFDNCSGLITVDPANPNYSSEDGILFNKNKTTLIQCPTSKSGSYTIPSSVASIGYRSFFNCSKLTSITIPFSVTTIGSYTFHQCSGLISVIIPSSITSIGSDAFNKCSGLTSLTIPSSVISIGSGAFSGCSSLNSVNIPSSITAIEDYAFQNCSGLKTVIIPSSVTSIGTASFWGCKSMTSINIPSSVNSIKNYAFYQSGLTMASIPSSVTSIGGAAFMGCIGLTSVNISTSLTSIVGQSFQNCSALTSVAIPSSVTSIGSYAFRNCSGLTSVTIPSSVKSIGISAFEGCIGLTSIKIPSSVTTIGSYAFSNCSGFITVDDANPNYSSKDGVIFNKNQSTLISCPTSKSGSYTIPNSVTSIENAFDNCSQLTSIIIPSSVTSIGSSAFFSCSGLTSITSFAKKPISISWNLFDKVRMTAGTLYVPVGSKALYMEAQGWKDFGNIVEMTDVSVQTQALANVIIYPNPVVESFKISGLIGSAEINIINTNGQVVLRQNVFVNQPIAVGALQKGTYFLKAHSNKGTTVIKFLKK